MNHVIASQEWSNTTMPVKHNKPGTPLPDGHPFKGTQIVFGAKRSVPLKNPSPDTKQKVPHRVERGIVKSKRPLAESVNRTGWDPVLEELKRQGLPPTRKNYLQFAYPDGIPKPWTQELENEIPEQLRNRSLNDPFPQSKKSRSMKNFAAALLKSLNKL